MAIKRIAGGAWVLVWIQHAEHGLIPVGLASGASYDEDFAVAPANVLGFLGPVDFDAQGYSCRLSIQMFKPETPDSGPWPDGGIKSLSELLPTRAEIQAGGGKPGEFEMMQFLNKSTGQVIHRFRRVIIANNGSQIAPNSYITANMQLMCVERVF